MSKPAILFLVFNRPDTTAVVFEAIKEQKPEQLFIAADGPRQDRSGEAELCKEVRNITSKVDWPCEVKTLFREENLGCRRAVSGAIDWFFEHVEEGIILEDDCLPDQSFFPYCSELLEKYRDDQRIMCIAGDRSFTSNPEQKDSYEFSSFGLIWGWATWRRAWQKNDFDKFKVADHESVARSINSNPDFVESRVRVFKSVVDGSLDTWDCVWSFCIGAQGALCCVPKKNLITNIGFGENATHTADTSSLRANYPSAAMEFPMKHPDLVFSNPVLDDKILQNIFYIGHHTSFLERIKRKISQLLKRIKR